MVTELFIKHIKHEKRYSLHTITAYKNDLNQFSNYLSSQYSITDLTKVNSSIVRSWLVSLIENKLSAKTINRKLSSIKAFYRFLQANGKVDSSPLVNVSAPRIPKKLPVFVEQDNMDQLFDQIDWGEDFTELRDRLIIELLYWTGIRRSELINLKTNDIDFSNQQIKVLGKRNKERIIPISTTTIKLLNNYLVKRSELLTKKKQCLWLFVTEKGNKVYDKLIYRVINRYLALVTTISKKSPHVLRHTFATHMLNNGADLNTIKEILGHSSLASTQVYTHNTIDKLKSVYKQAHPKA